LIAYEPGQHLRTLTLDYLRHEGQTPRIAVSTSGSSSVKRCVQAGLGFAIMPSWCVEGQEDGLTVLNLSDTLPQVPLYFGEADFLKANPYVQTLRRLCTEMIALRLSVRNDSA
jgi:DNA-binding transcriptional LysR family regulator